MTGTQARPTHLGELAEWAAAQHTDAVAQRWRRDGEWVERTYADLGMQALQLGRGLRGRGVQPGDRVGLLCATRPEWTICDLAIGSVGAVVVPVYPTNSAEEIAWVLGDSGATALFLESDDHAASLASVRDELPELACVFGIDTTADGVTSVATLAAEGADAAAKGPVEVDARDTATLMYTSGTTGNPKGCQLSYGNWRAVLDMVPTFATMGRDDVVYIYLPLAHLLTRMVQNAVFEAGATLAYSDGNMSAVVAELGQVSPTHLPSVPRLFEKIYAMVSHQAGGSGRADALERAVAVGLRVREQQAAGVAVSDADREAFDAAEQQVFGPVRAVFGGRVREALTGAAPIAEDVLRFFHAAGVPVYEAYGMTESTAVLTANHPGGVRFGTVGRAVSGIELQIANDGEILARSGGVFTGYWHNQQATGETIRDGWLHTGDLGAIDEDGYLTVTGRKKDIIITSGGKNLTPANLENDVRRNRYVADAVMCGDRRPHPVLLVTLDQDEVVPWATEQGKPTDLAELSHDEDLRAKIQETVDHANARCAAPARVRAMAVLERPFSLEEGELTPTGKVKRAVVTERFADVIDGLYSS